MSDSSRPHGLQPTRLLRPWHFPGKSTGVGCHCLLRIRTTLGHNKTRKAARSTSFLPPLLPTAAGQTGATPRCSAASITQRTASVTQAHSFRDTTLLLRARPQLYGLTANRPSILATAAGYWESARSGSRRRDMSQKPKSRGRPSSQVEREPGGGSSHTQILWTTSSSGARAATWRPAR